MAGGQIYSGTWEEIAQHADELRGKRVRLVVLEDVTEEGEQSQLPFWATATPEERAQSIIEWGMGHKPRNAPPLSVEAISRESIYFGEE